MTNHIIKKIIKIYNLLSFKEFLNTEWKDSKDEDGAVDPYWNYLEDSTYTNQFLNQDRLQEIYNYLN